MGRRFLFFAVFLLLPLRTVGQGVKCYTPALERALSGKPRSEFVLALPSFQGQRVSGQGHFTVFYNTTGDSAASEAYVTSALEYLEAAYDLEVTSLGNPAPPYSGSDMTYHVYIVNIAQAKFFGYTAPVSGGGLPRSSSGLPRDRSYIVIDNDYLDEGYRTKGDEAQRITLFHEFQHVIQWGSYGHTGDDSWLQELTAVWIEKLSTPDTKDYLFDLPSYFNTIDLRLDQPVGGGYGESVWMLYLTAKFGSDVARIVWRQHSDAAPEGLKAFEEVLAGYGSSFCQEYKRFGAALYQTGRRTVPHSPFRDASLFLSDSLRIKRMEAEPASLFALPASITYFARGFGRDTSVVVLARDADLALLPQATVAIPEPDHYTLATNSPGSFCDTLLRVANLRVKVFPQPLVLGKNERGTLYIEGWNEQYAPTSGEVVIFAADQSLIYHFTGIPPGLFGNYYYTWDGSDDRGAPVPSGVYLYRAITDGVRREGKILVVRESK